MSNVVIYYKKEQDESIEKTIERVKKLIKQLEVHHTIKGVYLDSTEDRTEFNEMLNSNLSEVDYMYISSNIDDEFDNHLISELSRTEQFEVLLFD